MAKKKQNTAFNVQVADFIRNHKKAGTAIDDEVTEKLVIPFVLDADGIDDLLERLTDGGISITDKDGNPSSKYVVEAPKPEELTDEELLGSNSAKVNDPVRMYLKEIGVVPLLSNEEEKELAIAVENLGKLMGIPTPVRIESFDNSNIMGTSPVSAMVVFENGKPNKKEYRKYKIKTVEGPDDYASMREVIRRRYSRVKRDGLTPPDLIIMDGGQGQVNVAKDVLRKELNLSIPVAGLQKNDKHQTNELLFGDPLRVIDLPRQSEEFFLLHRIQDEVHRFAITFHRQVRSKNSFSSKLDGVEGLGPKRKQKLLKHFKSMTAIQKATVEDIHSLGIPEKVAEALLDKLNDNN